MAGGDFLRRLRSAAVFFAMTAMTSPMAYALGPRAKAEAPSILGQVMQHILIWQFKLRQEMAGLMRSLAEGGDPLVWGALLGAAFIYGVIHAAGPGHGKAVATSYMLHGKRSAKEGILFGNLVAFSHGLSGIFIVLLLKWVIDVRFSTGLRDATKLTSQVSFSLIAILGLFLIVSGIRSSIKGESDKLKASSKAPTLFAAVSFGMIPCPGVVTAMLLAMGLHQAHLGVLTALAITLGMAVTTSAVVLLVVAGKNASSRISILSSPRLPGILSATSGLLLMVLAGWMLLG